MTSSPIPSPASRPRRLWRFLLLAVEAAPGILLACAYLAAREREMRATPWQFSPPDSISNGSVQLVRWLPANQGLELVGGSEPPPRKPADPDADDGSSDSAGEDQSAPSRLMGARRYAWNFGRSTLTPTSSTPSYSLDTVVSQDGTTTALCVEETQIALSESATGRLQRTITASAPVTCLALSSDARLLAVGSTARAEVWDARTGELLSTLRTGGSVGHIGFSPGSHLIAASIPLYDGVEVRVWNVANGQPRGHFRSSTTISAADFALAPDERTIAISGNNQDLALRDINTHVSRVLHSPGYASASNMAFSPDGQWLATTSSEGVNLWDVKTATLRRSMAASPSGAAPPPDPSNTTNSGSSPAADIEPTYGFVSVSFSPDSRRLAASTGHRIVLWQLR